MIKILNIGTVTRNNWILETPNGVIAVDTGLPGQSKEFLKKFKKNWHEDDLKYIFLTHAHIDHAGFLAELLAQSQTRLVLSDESRRALAMGSKTEPHEYRNWLGRILEKSMINALGKYPVFDDISRMVIVRDNDTFFEDMGIPARVVFLPGHTDDSIGLHLYDDRIIICGDAAMNRPPLNANRNIVLIESIDKYQRSWERMLSMNVDKIYPAHGKPFSAKDLMKYSHYLDGVKLTRPLI